MIGGEYTDAVHGDGIDCYAGGANGVIEGCTFYRNLNGIVIKNDELNRDHPGEYGIVSDVYVRRIIARDCAGFGITVHRASGVSAPDDPTIPLVQRVSIRDCDLQLGGLGDLCLGGARLLVEDVRLGRLRVLTVY